MIHEAAKTGALAEVQRYLDEGEDVNKQDNVSATISVSLIASSLSGWRDSSLRCLLLWLS
jgi:hypothetical protein